MSEKMSEFKETIVRSDRFCGVFLENVDFHMLFSEYGKEIIRKVARYVLIGIIAQKKALSDEVLDGIMNEALTFVRKSAEKIYLDELNRLVSLDPIDLKKMINEVLTGETKAPEDIHDDAWHGSAENE